MTGFEHRRPMWLTTVTAIRIGVILLLSPEKNGKAFVVKGRQRRQHNNVRLVFSEAKMFRGKLVNILLSIVKSMILEFVLSARKHPYNHMGSLVTCL